MGAFFVVLTCLKVSGPSRRYIGSYTDRSIGGAYKYAYEFPASREVDRYLYKQKKATKAVYLVPIPASPEVDRYLYIINLTPHKINIVGFPSPLEVDRYLYPISCM